MQKLGRNTLLGCELIYAQPIKSFKTGFSLRYKKNKNQRYYFQYSEFMKIFSLYSLFRLDPSTQIATELAFQGDDHKSTASLGYRRKVKNYEVTSSFRTNGDIKSLFTFKNSQIYNIRFYLSGNLYREDFKSGYSFNIGHAE